ncbi:lantibiotic dehydratase [Nonomuraea sp. NPDC048892]|uniref:lantibiotic dehydratase n=1 Tax=Nonomuraea sp. NPDC048892 TaxID=3154624 RepID=UPI0033DD269D
MTTDPGDLELPALGATPEAEQHWLSRIWTRPDVRAAVRVASPTLAEQLDQLAEGTDPARIRRLTLAVTSYLLRWQRRPTPFGLFAGIVPALLGHAAKADFGTRHQIMARADAARLGALIDRLEAQPHLLVTANSGGSVRGDRFVIPARLDVPAERPDLLAEVSIRHTRPVRLALAAASTPVRFTQLADHLEAAAPAVPADTIVTMLTSLVQQGALLSSLRPPTTVVDGLPHVISQLRALGGGLPDIADLLTELCEIQRDLARHHKAAPLADAEPLGLTVTARMTTISRSEHAVAADTAVDGQIIVPHAVAQEAASAASVLLRLTTRPFGAETWRDSTSRSAPDTGPARSSACVT